MRQFLEAGGQAEVLNAKRGRWRIDPAYLHILGQVIANARAELRRFSMNDFEEDEAGLWWPGMPCRDAWRANACA